jgi:predicted nucleotidyltransferase
VPEPGLVEHLRRSLEPRDEILEAYLFGSIARGQAQPHSDLDVAVFLDRPKVDDTGYGYRARLVADLLPVARGRSVDVVLLNDAKPLLYHRVLRDGIRLLSRDPRATTVREGRAISRYCDYVPQLRKIAAAHEKRIARGDFGR